MARNSFYQTQKWKQIRERVLRRDTYQCAECARYGRNRQATTVHHVIPLLWCAMHNAVLALASRNLISLCDECHNAMHNRQTEELTPRGIALVDRMYRDNKPEGWCS